MAFSTENLVVKQADLLGIDGEIVKAREISLWRNRDDHKKIDNMDIYAICEDYKTGVEHKVRIRIETYSGSKMIFKELTDEEWYEVHNND